MRNPITRAVTVAVVVVVLVAGRRGVRLPVVGSARRLGRSEFAQAVAGAPAGAERLSWTDWAGVRRELGSDVDATVEPDEAARLPRRRATTPT